MTPRCLACAAHQGGPHEGSCQIRGPVEPHHTRSAPVGAEEAGRTHMGDVKPIYAEDFSLLTQWWDSNRSRFRSTNSRRAAPHLLH